MSENHQKTEKHPELMTIAYLADRTGFSRSFWHQAVADGRIRHHRFGKGQGGIRITEEQYQEFLRATEKGGASVPPTFTHRRSPSSQPS